MRISKVDLIKQIMSLDGDTISSEDLAKMTGIELPNVKDELAGCEIPDEPAGLEFTSGEVKTTIPSEAKLSGIFRVEDLFKSSSFSETTEPVIGGCERGDGGPDEDFISRCVRDGYPRELSEEYLKVLKGKISYAEFLKNHNDVYEKQQRRMLVNRIIGATKCGAYSSKAYYFNNIKIMAGSNNRTLKNDYDVKSRELANKYIGGFEESSSCMEKIGLTLKFINKELQQQSENKMSHCRPIDSNDIPKLLAFALFRPDDASLRKELYSENLSEYIDKEIIEALCLVADNDRELTYILKSVEKVCEEYTNREMYSLVDMNFKAHYKMRRLQRLADKVSKLDWYPDELVGKRLKSCIKSYTRITGIEIQDPSTQSQLMSVIQSDLRSGAW